MTKRSWITIGSLFFSLFIVGFVIGITSSNSDDSVNRLVASNITIVHDEQDFLLAFSCGSREVLYSFNVESNLLIHNTFAIAAMRLNPPVRFSDTIPKDAMVALAGGASGGLTINGLVRGLLYSRKLSLAEKILAVAVVVSGPGLGFMVSEFAAPSCYSNRLRSKLADKEYWHQIKLGMLGIGYQSLQECIDYAKGYYLVNSRVREIEIRNEIIELTSVAGKFLDSAQVTPVVELYVRLINADLAEQVLQSAQNRLYQMNIDRVGNSEFKTYLGAVEFCDNMRLYISLSRLEQVAREDVEILKEVQAGRQPISILKERVMEQEVMLRGI